MTFVKYDGEYPGVVLPDGVVCLNGKATEVREDFVQGLVNSGVFVACDSKGKPLPSVEPEIAPPSEHEEIPLPDPAPEPEPTPDANPEPDVPVSE